MPLTWHIVEDRNPAPARYSVAAALLINALNDTSPTADRRVGFAHLPYQCDEHRYPDGCQHVSAHGALLPSGMVHFERLTGIHAPLPVDLTALFTTESTLANRAPVEQHSEDIEPCAQQGEDADVLSDVVIPIHPGVTAPVVDADEMAALCARNGFAYRIYRVDSMDRSNPSAMRRASDDASNGQAPSLRLYREDDGWQSVHQADICGRWVHEPSSPNNAASSASPARDPIRSVRIALIGAESVQREQYPATLMALADAADAAGLNLRVDFLNPTARGFAQATTRRRLTHYQGVLLPGGADMRRVPGMTAVCGIAWQADLPTLGLCLGMQAMVTEAVQRRVGSTDATLPEFDAKTSLPSFVPIERYRGDSKVAGARPKQQAASDRTNVVADATDFHRVGVHALQIKHPRRRFAWMRRSSTVHYNHRYMLNPMVERRVEEAGIAFAAWAQQEDLSPVQPTKPVVDVVVAASRRFYVGYQGHPELMSRSDAPHPALLAFLRAASIMTRPARRTGHNIPHPKRRSLIRRWFSQKATHRRSRRRPR